MQFESTEVHSIVGDECHIASSKPNGPRHAYKSVSDDFDSIDNLVLLCKTHHKLVDDRIDVFTVDKLRDLKIGHERWVENSLRNSDIAGSKLRVRFMSRVVNGTQLANLIVGSLAYLLDNEHPESETEAEAIANFHQDIVDWGDLMSMTEPSTKVRCGFNLGAQVTELESMGFRVFATQVNYSDESGSSASNWPTLVLSVVRSTNPGITALGELATVITPARVGV
jgi:hypothetical protein